MRPKAAKYSRNSGVSDMGSIATNSENVFIEIAIEDFIYSDICPLINAPIVMGTGEIHDLRAGILALFKKITKMKVNKQTA